MGRWTQYDEDDYRLPEGMTRVGYDADTQKYTFKDQSGNYWEGLAGAEYGELRKVGDEQGGSADLEATAPTRADGYLSLPAAGGEVLRNRNRDAWRQLLPFFLIVIVFLLLVFRLSPSVLNTRPFSCVEHSRPYTIRSGDTCWSISKEYSTTLDDLRTINPDVDCSALSPGQHLCVPVDD